jgi:hypothetical protein
MFGAWWRATKGQRENLPSKCFLDPANRKYVICPERGPRRPTCDGLLAARRRTILTGVRCGLEQKAIAMARRKGCEWAQESAAMCPRRGR